MPTISVIIPAYNSEITIERTINSVLQQTFTDFELIIINDGSEDSTLNIIAQFNDFRIRVFSYPNCGGNISRNRGIQVASGKFLSFLDADDLWTADKLQSQLHALQENKGVKVGYSWTDYIDEKDNFLLSGTHITANGDVYEKLFINNFLENGSNPLIDKEAILDLGGFDESLNAGQDWDMWLRLAEKYSFVAVPSVQILYRISPNSRSSNLTRQEEGCIKVLDKAYEARSSLSKFTRQKSFANLYKYLTCKALQQPFSRQKGLAAAIFFCKYVINNSSRLTQVFFYIKLLLKIIFIITIPTFYPVILFISKSVKVKKAKIKQNFTFKKFSIENEF